MDFYLTAERTGQRIQFPLNPEKSAANTGARISTYDTIVLGEIATPKGRKAARIPLEGIFPGESRLALGILKSWTPPGELVGQLQSWRDEGEKLRLLITETPLNLDVYIDTFEHSYAGGHGDVSFSLELVEARTIAIYTEEEYPTLVLSATIGSRGTVEAPQSYVVKEGDSLWVISKKTLQDGSRWREIYDENREEVGTNPDLIYPGLVLRIPGGTGEPE